MPEADAEGALFNSTKPPKQKNDIMPETMFLFLILSFSCGQNSESRQKTQPRKMESISPKFCFHFPSPHLRIRITTLVERGRKFKINSFVEREISVCFENRFELGTIKTPELNSRVLNEPKCGRAEGTPIGFRLILQMNF